MNDDHVGDDPAGREESPRILAEVGGPIDEIHLTLGIHGPELDPDRISAMLGCLPTGSHRRGDMPGLGPAFRAGAWLLRVDGRAPVGPDELVSRLLEQVPSDPGVWAALRATYTVQLGFGFFVVGWNQGTELSSSTMQRLGALGVPVGFDVYSDDGDPQVTSSDAD